MLTGESRRSRRWGTVCGWTCDCEASRRDAVGRLLRGRIDAGGARESSEMQSWGGEFRRCCFRYRVLYGPSEAAVCKPIAVVVKGGQGMNKGPG